jgi:hypothetical protein
LKLQTINLNITTDQSIFLRLQKKTTHIISDAVQYGSAGGVAR